MGTTDAGGVWAAIQQGVQDTERLIGQKQYNMAMIKARQTLEYMVKFLDEKALIVDSDLVDSIDQLYEGRFITKLSMEHYHRIRVLGNKAVHDGNNSASDASQAYQLLSHEAHTFAAEYAGRRRPPQSRESRGGASRGASSRGASSHGSSSRGGASRSSGSRSGSRQGSHTRSRRRSRRGGFNPYELIKPAILLVIIVILAALIKFLVLDKKKEEPETTAPSVTAEETMAPTTSPETTAPPPETEPAPVYKTTSDLKVRSSASKDNNDNVLGVLPSGTQVEYIGAYNEEWTSIRYNDREAYVYTEYLTEVQP